MAVSLAERNVELLLTHKRNNKPFLPGNAIELFRFPTASLHFTSFFLPENQAYPKYFFLLPLDYQVPFIANGYASTSQNLAPTLALPDKQKIPAIKLPASFLSMFETQ